MINEKCVYVGTKGLVVLTFPFDDHIDTFLLGQNKAGNSPGIANKKGTFLWDNQISPSFCFRYCGHNNTFSLIILKLSWSLFLAKIYNREVENN